jgi:hypothetical protein
MSSYLRLKEVKVKYLVSHGIMMCKLGVCSLYPLQFIAIARMKADKVFGVAEH